ncbi:hypothetical protein HJFPF1_09442 [Paramyrothecium foliicola]|nr:hypothetical protein HJFPF1_09442 [Paramyrothecium foliicola]
MPSSTHPGSIFSRNKEDTIEAEAMLWRAKCDSKGGKALRKYVTDDCVIVDPDENKVYSQESEPSTKEYIESFEPWTAYRIEDDPQFVEIDMMSSGLTYRVTAWRHDGKDMIPTNALCSSVWRQSAGGDWQCCMHHMTKI